MTQSLPLSRSRLVLFLLALVLALGGYLRVAAVAGTVVPNPVRADAQEYLFYAVNLQDDGVYSLAAPRAFGGAAPTPDAKRPPGYPAFIAAFLGGHWNEGANLDRAVERILLAQALLGTGVILLAFLIARRIAGNGVGLAAAVLAALSPHLVNTSVYLLSEALFAVVFLLAVWLLVRAATRPGPALAEHALAGACIALSVLVRPTTSYLPWLLLGAGVLFNRERWRAWLALMLAYQVVMLPWLLRNLVVTGASGDSTLFVAAIQVGSYPNFMYDNLPESLGIPYRFDPVLTDFSSLSRALSVMAERAIAAPGEYLQWYTVGKVLALFRWDIIPIGSGGGPLLVGGDIYVYPTPVTPYANQPVFILTYLLSRLVYFPIVALALLAMVLAWVPRCAGFWGAQVPAARMLSLCLLYVIGVHVIGFPLPRYAVPFQPLLYLLALFLIARAWHWHRQRQAGVVGPAAAGL